MVMDIKRLDIYRKIPKDLTQPTTTGAIVSICCVSFIVLMIFTEVSSFEKSEAMGTFSWSLHVASTNCSMFQFAWFIYPDIRSELHVENNNPNER